MLKELALPYFYVPVNAHDGSAQKAEFLKLNPNGRVPVIEDGGFVLYESMAINLYLARQYPSPLSARGTREEALIEQWSFWGLTEIEKPLLWAGANLKLFESDKRSAEEVGLAMTKLVRPFRVLDRHVAERDYLVGDRFTVADLNVSSVMTLIPLCGIDISDYPAMQRWLARTLERPAAEDWKPISFGIPRPGSVLGVMQMLI